MRILLITHFFPPKHNAGTENYTLGIAEALQSRGHQVQVLCAEDWEAGEAYWNGVTDEEYHKVPVKRLHLNWKKASQPNRVIYDSEYIEEWMAQYLENEQFDIIHITSNYSLGVGIMRSIKGAKIPLVLSLMDFWFLCPSVQLFRSNGGLCNGITTALECQSCMLADMKISQRLERIGMPLKTQVPLWSRLSDVHSLTRHRGIRGYLLNIEERKQLLKKAIELPDLILSHSKTVQEIFRLHTQRKIKLLQNGQALSWLKDYHGKTLSETLRIGYIGQIIPIKGVRLLVGAFRKASFKGKAQLEIWGSLEKDRVYVHHLKKLIAADPLISLRGRFDHDNLASVFAHIDVLVVPSIWYENAPLAIQEAFAAETPVIATNLGGMGEAVSHNVNGLLFERGNTADLVRQLRRFVEDPDLCKKLTAGIKPVKRVEEEVIELEANYYSLMQRQTSERLRREIRL
jgi:glycosyltransferase involved in cell wall biosynthesis